MDSSNELDPNDVIELMEQQLGQLMRENVMLGALLKKRDRTIEAMAKAAATTATGETDGD